MTIGPTLRARLELATELTPASMRGLIDSAIEAVVEGASDRQEASETIQSLRQIIDRALTEVSVVLLQ